MRKLLAILQIFVLMAAMALPTAFAAEAPIMLAGLEAASSSSSTEAQHDWDTNLFFQTMQEKTGIAFSFTEYVSREAWTEAKTEMLAGGSGSVSCSLRSSPARCAAELSSTAV